jgi:hypothetical protein
MGGTVRRRYDDILPGHHERVFEITLESGEPLHVTIGHDNTVIAMFPDRRRTYRHTAPAHDASLYAIAGQPGFTIAHSMPGLLVLSAPGDGPSYVWHLEDSESSTWVFQ